MSAVQALWFYVEDSERKGPVPRAKIEDLVASGLVGNDTFVWSEGMADWAPVIETELLRRADNPPALPPHLKTATAGVAPEVLPAPKLRGGNRVIAILCAICTYAVIGYFAFPVFAVLRGKMTIAEATEFQADPVMAEIAGMTLLAGAMLFLMWNYRTTKNLVALRGSQSITPAGSVYWYFVPIWNLWKPMQAMENMRRGFGTEKSTAANVYVWWGLFWLSNLADVVLPLILSGSPIDAKTGFTLNALASGAAVAFYYLGVFLMLNIAKGERLAVAAARTT